MKRSILAIIACVSLAGVYAQATAGNGLDSASTIRSEAEIYPVRLDVTRVYTHAQGFKVVYRKGMTSFGELYIPITWFVPGGKAMLIRGRGPQYPYLVVYYKPDKTFSHAKLFVSQFVSDPSWGTIEGDPGDKFKVESIKLDF